MCATTPMLWVMSRMLVPVRSRIRRSSARISAWTVTSSAVVGSSASSSVGLVGERQGEHDPLLLPAGELVRVVAQPLLGLGDLDLAQQLDGARLGRLAADAAVGAQRLADLPAHGADRVERGLRLLEDHRDRLPRSWSARPRAAPSTSSAAQPDRPGRDGPVGAAGR